jgi:hypothetical protein
MWWEQNWPVLAAIVFHAGVSYAQLRGVGKRLDQVNGRLNNHGERIVGLERSDARRDGAEEALTRVNHHGGPR